MTTYVVASKANQPYLSECQILGEYVEQNTPDVSVKYVIKDQSEWGEFVDSVCRSYGFEKKTCPIIYTLEGTLIGDGRDFVDHVRERYGKSLTITKESQKNRTKINVEENDERMRKKHKGETLGEKIENHLEKKKKQEVSQLVGDSFYNECWEAGIPFQVRRTNVLRDMPAFKKQKEGDEVKQLNMNKTMTVPDERLQRHLELKKEAEADASRDRTFEEFKEMYLDHIDGKVDAGIRVANRPDSADVEPVSRGGPRTGMSNNANEIDGEDGEGRKTTKSKKDYESIASDGKRGSAVSIQGSEVNKAKYDIPNSCKMQMQKLNRIEKLDEDYVLVAHPYPQLEGEMLLFQLNDDDTKKDDKEDEDANKEILKQCLIYKDYSLRKRIPTEAKPPRITAYQKKKMMDDDQEKTRLQCLEVDLETPLSTIDWANFSLVINEIKGMGWIQILPVGQKSSQPFQFNIMHIIPSSKIPFPKVPLDMMIKNKVTFLKKQDKRSKNPGSVNQILHVPIHEREQEASESNLTLIDEFSFPHAVYQISPADMNPEGLQYGYKKLYTFLGLAQRPDVGITLVIAPQWMFMATITQPYHREKHLNIEGYDQEGGVPVYLDGFSYSGILNIQDIQQQWPQTADIGHSQHSIIGSLCKQSAETAPEDDVIIPKSLSAMTLDQQSKPGTIENTNQDDQE